MVFDTAPTLSLADSLYISRYADKSISVVKHNSSTNREFAALRDQFETIGKSVDYYIYNSFQKPLFNYYYDRYYYYYSKNYCYGDSDE